MQKYILRRTLIMIPTLLGITLLIFAAASLMPGDALSAMMGGDPSTSSVEIEAQRARLGLDDPWTVQYLRWLTNLLGGDLGNSLTSGETVAEAIGLRLLPTLQLMGFALAFAIIVGVGLGIVAALKQYSLTDNVLTVIGFMGISMPVFFLGMLFIYVFSLKLNWLPSSGMRTSGVPYDFADNLRHLILPALSIGLLRSVQFMRYTRTAMIEVLTSDYLRTAHAKGLRERRVILLHALRNALIPIITVLGMALPSLLAGAVFIESIFQWPGMGLLFIRSTTQRDYPVLMGIVLITSLSVLLSNLLIDVAYAFVDPRIRYER